MCGHHMNGEQITVVLPRETVDAMRFFADIEVAASTFANQQPVDGDNITMEKKEYHLGSLAMCQDIIDESRDCRIKCGYLWNTIECAKNGAVAGTLNISIR